MSAAVDIEQTLRTIDEACQNWPQRFKTNADELIPAIQELFSNPLRALIHLSISSDDDEQAKQNQCNAERIVSNLKELHHSMGNLWPSNMESFARDIFDVDQYHVEAAEFFHPVPFYPDSDHLMKLYRWSVYDTNGTIICRYYLENSELMPGQPYYVLGKSYPNGHSQIQPYAVIPHYDQMKSHVINDIKGQGPSPIASLHLS